VKRIAISLPLLVLFALVGPAQTAEKPVVVAVWPGNVPGETKPIGEENVREQKAGQKTIKLLTNVSKPTLTIYRPAKDKDTGASVVICPGGGYHILAWDLEGEEAASWLNSLGVTGIILKYRVPRRPGQPGNKPPIGPLQDAQRAMSLVRGKAKEWGLDPKRIGILGFSAGGHLAASASTNFDKRAYEPTDEIDTISCRPDFAVLIYPAYLVENGKEQLNPDIRVRKDCPPTFFAHAGDDALVPPDNSILMYRALKRAGVPADLHVYTTGGHGFGLRPSEKPCSTWPGRCEDWLRSQKLLVRAAAPGGEQTSSPSSIPKGEVIKYTFDHSKIFPGTVRDYWVYVPRQYDPAKPACVYVNQDGVQYKAPAVFDELIHKKEMPVVIGVFVMHGRVKAPSDAALDRYNRSYEYDGLGDNYARFLLDELLPEVEKKTASDGRPIRLSRDGNDRCIGGASSGAICAFTAAWERPDAFRRVFSAIGTYVSLRGGNAYPTLIRKYEPKPIRVFLQDGSADLNIYGGDWWMANQEMERALRFAGYEVNHVWGTGGHSGQHATEIFPEAMRWLWKDWPNPVKAGLGSRQLRDILIPGEDWKLVAKGYGFTEGPAVNSKGEVFFNDVPASKTYKIGLDGAVSLFLADTKRGDGQRFGPDGRLYAVAGAANQILAYDGDQRGVAIAEGFRGNDLVVRHDGGIYVTHPGWNGTDPSKVWYISPKGEKRVVDTGLKFSNGITLSPDQSLLYVADSRTHWVYSYQIQPDGSLAHKQRYFHLHVPDNADDSGADGLRVDRDGRLYVATRLGLQVCDQAGRVTCIIPTPNGKISNLCFGGENYDTLFATCGDRVFKRKVKIKGAMAFQPPHKPARPQL
jgi:sugar lactone lactonase YvrE/acetyl esterase/lipase/enterochelin esterase-like enzyme